MAEFTGKTELKAPEIWNLIVRRDLNFDGSDFDSNPAEVTVFTRTMLSDGYFYYHETYPYDDSPTFDVDALQQARYNTQDRLNTGDVEDPMSISATVAAPANPVAPV